VAVNAGADQDYVLHKFGGKAAAKAESFVLAQGNSFGGMTRDPSLEKAQFADIAKTLVPDLAVERFFPAKDPKAADLLIVVHWGETSVDHFFKQQMMEDILSGMVGHTAPSGEPGVSRSAVTDPGFSGQDVEAMAAGAAGPINNPQLLGYESELKKAQYRALGAPFEGSKPQYQLSIDTFGEDIFYENERYFVILEAYDFASVRNGRKGVKPKLLWSVHYSITASGYNFASALPAMSKVAANYFGRDMGGLVLDARKVPEGFVKVGEPRQVDDKKTN
jgi:hypothetical protein